MPSAVGCEEEAIAAQMHVERVPKQGHQEKSKQAHPVGIRHCTKEESDKCANKQLCREIDALREQKESLSQKIRNAKRSTRRTGHGDLQEQWDELVIKWNSKVAEVDACITRMRMRAGYNSRLQELLSCADYAGAAAVQKEALKNGVSI